MTLHYFVLEKGLLRIVAPDQMERIWFGELLPTDGNLSILSVVHDETENIIGCYFLLVSVVGGKITRESVEQAQAATLQQALSAAHGDCESLPAYIRQTSGWPHDWTLQVAKAMRVDVEQIRNMGIGGPLLTSTAMIKSVKEAGRMHAEWQRPV